MLLLAKVEEYNFANAALSTSGRDISILAENIIMGMVCHMMNYDFTLLFR